MTALRSYALVTEMKKGAYKKFVNMGQKMEDIVPVVTYVDGVSAIPVPGSISSG